MQQGTISHLLLPEDRSDLNQRVDVVCGIEKGETLAEDGEQDDADRPDVDLGRLRRAFQEHLGSPEPSGAGSVGTAGGPLVVLGIAGRWCLAERFAVFDLEPPILGAVLAKTVAAFRSFALATSEYSLRQGEADACIMCEIPRRVQNPPTPLVFSICRIENSYPFQLTARLFLCCRRKTDLRWFDVSVYDTMSMYRFEGREH